MTQFLISVLTAIIGSVGFALLFSVDLKHLPYSAVGGGISWAVYLLIYDLSVSVLAASLVAAFAATIFSELCARYNRTPATVFLLPSLIPLVPGGSLYYTMSNLLSKNYADSAKYAAETASVVLGLSGGVVAASLIVYAIRNAIRSRKDKKQNN